MLTPDLVQKEVTHPPNRWCQSGHVAPDVFRRGGATSQEEPTRFFQVSSNADSKVNGVYCEPCLIVAHAHARSKKG